MKTLQIAGGVFLGIMAVLFVINVPRWLGELRVEHKRDVIRTMTPEKLIASCGQPKSDKEEDLANLHTAFVRSMEYKGSFSTVVVEFNRANDTRWMFNHIKVGSVQEIGSWDKDGASRMILELPCMDK